MASWSQMRWHDGHSCSYQPQASHSMRTLEWSAVQPALAWSARACASSMRKELYVTANGSAYAVMDIPLIWWVPPVLSLRRFFWLRLFQGADVQDINTSFPPLVAVSDERVARTIG